MDRRDVDLSDLLTRKVGLGSEIWSPKRDLAME